MHTLPYYKAIDYSEANLDNSEKYYSNCISLPMYPSLSNEDQEYVIEKVIKFLYA